tara:strand:+ start:218 stop:493 length:276 start_codon:yes stop_codon:yes gene_type:complete
MGDLKVPLALVVVIIAQTVGAVFYLSEQAHRIEHLEKSLATLNQDVDTLWSDTADLITFATYTENRWAEAYSGDMTYIRLFGNKLPPEKEN